MVTKLRNIFGDIISRTFHGIPEALHYFLIGTMWTNVSETFTNKQTISSKTAHWKLSSGNIHHLCPGDDVSINALIFWHLIHPITLRQYLTLQSPITSVEWHLFIVLYIKLISNHHIDDWKDRPYKNDLWKLLVHRSKRYLIVWLWHLHERVLVHLLITQMSERNGQHFADDILTCFYLMNEWS